MCANFIICWRTCRALITKIVEFLFLVVSFGYPILLKKTLEVGATDLCSRTTIFANIFPFYRLPDR